MMHAENKVAQCQGNSAEPILETEIKSMEDHRFQQGFIFGNKAPKVRDERTDTVSTTP
jgi:hypothetical protein